MIPHVKRHLIKFHEDDRAQRLQDVYKVGMQDSQINISYVNSTEHCVGWHYHTKQTEYWFVVKGALKVGLVRSEAKLDEKKIKMLRQIRLFMRQLLNLSICPIKTYRYWKYHPMYIMVIGHLSREQFLCII